MSDIIKEPNQAGQAPTESKNDNKWLILAIVVVSVIFLLPLVILMMIFGFLGNIFREMPFDDYGTYNRVSITLTDEQTKAVQSIWVIVNDEELAAKGIGRTECRVLEDIAKQYSDANHKSGQIWYNRDVCADESLSLVFSESATGVKQSILIKEDGKWTEFDFDGFRVLETYHFDYGNYSMHERYLVEYPLVDGSIEKSKEKELPMPPTVPDRTSEAEPDWADASRE